MIIPDYRYVNGSSGNGISDDREPTTAAHILTTDVRQQVHPLPVSPPLDDQLPNHSTVSPGTSTQNQIAGELRSSKDMHPM